MNYSFNNKILQLIFLSLLLMGCKNQENSNYHDIIIGNWAYIDNKGVYCEMYIDSIEILSQPEFGMYHGPFKYSIVNNMIFFNNMSYKIVIIDCSRFRFISPNYNLMFEKIHIDKSLTRDDLFYGFFLRRCYFLVNKGRLSNKEAYDALKEYNFNEFEDIVTEEEIISH